MTIIHWMRNIDTISGCMFLTNEGSNVRVFTILFQESVFQIGIA